MAVSAEGIPLNLISQEDVMRVCELLIYLMKNNQRGKVYTILKDFKARAPESDITFFLNELLPYGDLLFYRYVRGECQDMMNSFYTFDQIMHNMKPDDIINLLKFDIIQPEYAARINEVSLDTVLYMIMQFNEYQDGTIEWLMQKYTGVINNIGLANHILFYNVIHDIMVFLKALREKDNLKEDFVSFDKVLESYEFIHKNNAGNILTRSRLINAINIYVDICKKESHIMPHFDTFYNKFNRLFTVSGVNAKLLKKALRQLCKDCHNYISDKLPWGLQSY
jgi:hypothetical protein